MALAVIAFRFAGIGHALRLAQAYQRHTWVRSVRCACYLAWELPFTRASISAATPQLGHADLAQGESELVAGGPYAYIRHPIYSGISRAMLGSAIGRSIFWALLLLLFAPYFVYSARRKEGLMREQFPDQYPDYMRRTNMLLPFVL